MNTNNVGMCMDGWEQTHQFEPRYDDIKSINPVDGSDYSKTIYVRDVCVKCGATIERVDK